MFYASDFTYGSIGIEHALDWARRTLTRSQAVLERAAAEFDAAEGAKRRPDQKTREALVARLAACRDRMTATLMSAGTITSSAEMALKGAMMEPRRDVILAEVVREEVGNLDADELGAYLEEAGVGPDRSLAWIAAEAVRARLASRADEGGQRVRAALDLCRQRAGAPTAERVRAGVAEIRGLLEDGQRALAASRRQQAEAITEAMRQRDELAAAEQEQHRAAAAAAEAARRATELRERLGVVGAGTPPTAA